MIKNKKLEIIAEMGQGYEGSLDKAMMLVKSASNTTVDAVKFQMVFADELAIRNYKYYPLFKSLELKYSEWNKVTSFLKRNNKKVYFDIFGIKSLQISEKLKVDGIKIHPTDILNFGFLEKIKKSKIGLVFLGIGGLNYQSINKVVDFFDNKKIILLNGFQSYPTKLQDNNLNNIAILKKKYFKEELIDFGFADHEPGGLEDTMLLSAVAIGAGANYLEKHFTLTETLKMEDYESALSPEDFNIYTNKMKNIFLSKSVTRLDNYKISFKEKKYHNTNIRQVIAKKDIKKGAIIKNEDLCLLRSNDKLALSLIDDCVNKQAKIFIKKNKPIKKSYLK